MKDATPLTDKKATAPPQKGEFTGSRFTPVAPGITLGCISREARDLLTRVMEAWEPHLADLKRARGKDYEPGRYGFAYWLIRWSGLVAPSVGARVSSPGSESPQTVGDEKCDYCEKPTTLVRLCKGFRIATCEDHETMAVIPERQVSAVQVTQGEWTTETVATLLYDPKTLREIPAGLKLIADAHNASLKDDKHLAYLYQDARNLWNVAPEDSHEVWIAQMQETLDKKAAPVPQASEERSGAGEVHGPNRPRIHNKKMLDAIEAVIIEHSSNEVLAAVVRKFLSAEASEVEEEQVVAHEGARPLPVFHSPSGKSEPPTDHVKVAIQNALKECRDEMCFLRSVILSGESLSEKDVRQFATRLGLANAALLSSPGVSEHATGVSLEKLREVAERIGRAYNDADWFRAYEILKCAFPPVSVVEEKQDSGEKEDLDLPGGTNTR